MGRYVPQLKFLEVLLGDEPVLPPAAQLYQRLLAMDQRESRVLIDLYLKDHSISDLYDEVLIPAMNMAEEDRHKGELSETRETFLLKSLEELIAELADYVPDSGDKAEPGNGASKERRRPFLAHSVRVLCLPAGDKADEISAAMLAQALERNGYATVSFPVVSSPAELLESLSYEAGDVVCISALPPFALINARSISKVLRSKFPELRIVVGLWGFTGGGERAEERLGRAFTVDVVTTIAQAVERIGASADTLALRS
jgi:methylmalonyl-CoA mutase cobalamin-binding subunit